MEDYKEEFKDIDHDDLVVEKVELDDDGVCILVCDKVNEVGLWLDGYIDNYGDVNIDWNGYIFNDFEVDYMDSQVGFTMWEFADEYIYTELYNEETKTFHHMK